MLYEEGAEEPRMMSLGLHDRVIGRPGRASGLARFLDYIQSRDGVYRFPAAMRSLTTGWRSIPFA